jgi:hypothetical protein
MKQLFIALFVFALSYNLSAQNWEGDTTGVPAEFFDQGVADQVNDVVAISITATPLPTNQNGNSQPIETDSSALINGFIPIEHVTVDFDMPDSDPVFIHIEIGKTENNLTTICQTGQLEVDSLITQQHIIANHAKLEVESMCTFPGVYVVSITFEYENKVLGQTSTKSFTL